jgi:hypothetical protein
MTGAWDFMQAEITDLSGVEKGSLMVIIFIGAKIGVINDSTYDF